MMKKFRYPALVFAAAALALGAAAGTYVYMSYGVSVVVPQLVGIEAGEAGRALASIGLSMDKAGESHDQTVPEGRVLRQYVEPGARVMLGTPVQVIVSRGPVVTEIPTVTGHELAEARNFLLHGGIAVSRVIGVRSDSVAVGMVIAQRPRGGSISGEPLVLVVSTGGGDRMYAMPDFTGMTAVEALALARRLGIEVAYRYAGGIPSSTGIAISQYPPPGTVARPGDIVKIDIGGMHG
jgi:serine/threonine-protein kinase